MQKAKKYIIDTEFGEVVINFNATVSNEEIENGIIPHLFDVKAEFEFVGDVTVPDNFVEMEFELVSPEEYSARTEEEYGNMCPGVGF